MKKTFQLMLSLSLLASLSACQVGQGPGGGFVVPGEPSASAPVTTPSDAPASPTASPEVTASPVASASPDASASPAASATPAA